MTLDISPLFARLKKRYTRLPRTTGVFFSVTEPCSGVVVRTSDNAVLTSAFSGRKEFNKLIQAVVRPHVICVCKSADYLQPRELLSYIQKEYETIIFTDPGKVLQFLGLSGSTEELAGWIKSHGFELMDKYDEYSCRAALAAFMGFFYLSDEYEHDEQKGVVTPLLYECHQLFRFLRLVPYGEVTTFKEVAKALGLQWNEQRIMEELSRLPGEAEVFGHRLLHRDGRLCDSFAGGVALQKELLKWELVPFAAGECVDLKQALWTRQKYRPLTNFLRHAGAAKKFVEINFAGIEKILNVPLSRAARRLGSWWQDDKPHAWIWQDAGCRIANVNMQGQTVVFGSLSREPQDIDNNR